MSEIKPVSWLHIQGDYTEPCSWEIDDDMAGRGWSQEPLYLIPNTHRIVSVELLRRLIEENIYYASKAELRATIDKGQS
jgi:hypothetical protein